jgi:hypothetical protein
MGGCISLDKPMVQVGTKIVRKNEMKTLKTYQDALRIAGHIYVPGTPIAIYYRGDVSFVEPYSQFRIVDKIIYNGFHIHTKKLYGRRT